MAVSRRFARDHLFNPCPALQPLTRSLAPNSLLLSMASTFMFLLLSFFFAVLIVAIADAGLGEHGYGAVKVLGSRPPLCVNRCMNCRPCRVTLVAFPRGRSSSPEEAGDEIYYLVAWMCRCGDSLFQP